MEEKYLERQTAWYANKEMNNPKESAEKTLDKWILFLSERNSMGEDKKIDEEGREIEILTHSLLGYMYTTNEYDLAVGRANVPQSPTEYWDDKRPYGNKDVPSSIVHKLGWGTYEMRSGWLPKIVEEETWRMHNLVYERLKEIEEFLESIFKNN